MAVRITKDEFAEKVLKSELPVLVDFYSDSCVACKRLAPVLGDAEDNYEGKINVVKVNTNFDGELSSEYGVKANPTVILFKNGEAVDRKIGAITYKDLEAWIEANI